MTTLLAVAHGTTDPAGLAEVRRLVNVVRTRRPELPVQLCWLERAEPLLPEVLASLPGPVVVVPLLLSTGYHVKTDIAAAVAGRPQTAVARQLGPDRRITQVVYERLMAGREPDEEADVVLFSAGSSDPEAFEQLAAVAEQLQQLIRQSEGSDQTRVYPSFLSTADGWATDLPEDPDVANYLLAPGQFNDRLRDAAAVLGARSIAAPIGAHPSLSRVIWDRYDEAARTLDGLG